MIAFQALVSLPEKEIIKCGKYEELADSEVLLLNKRYVYDFSDLVWP